MFKKKKIDTDELMEETVYGTTGGIPRPEPGVVSVGKTRRRNEKNFFQRLFSSRKTVKAPSGKPKKPGFFKNLFSGSGFKRRKGIDGF